MYHLTKFRRLALLGALTGIAWCVACSEDETKPEPEPKNPKVTLTAGTPTDTTLTFTITPSEAQTCVYACFTSEAELPSAAQLLQGGGKPFPLNKAA